jgi:eukaryotic-like serine/threonine-protein kinase
MPLTTGSRLGPYEILEPIGAGGMGEVYRARDTRLDRDVAIKILPAQVNGRDDLKQRFEREARVISSLNHPHICALHDVGEQDGISYLVMEFLRGEPLDKRIARGALPVAEALRIAIQIGDALDQAHKKGLIHRDLKPANVMLTPEGAKLLDFGIAKAMEPQHAATGLTSTATHTQSLTTEGAILGTLGYMAPEQLEGKDTDARTDVFAFGVVLYEMLTGKRAFPGGSQASVIGSIMSADPISSTELHSIATPALERTLKRCLAKSPDQRWHCVRDLVSELEWIGERGPQAGLPATAGATVRGGNRLGWMAAGLAAIVALALAVILFLHAREKQAGDRVVRFDFTLPEKTLMRGIDIPTPSPDGERIVFSAMNAEHRYALWIRPLSSPTLQQLPGTEDGILPFWSPDGRQIGFLAGGKLKRVGWTGGTPQTICDMNNNFGGATWNANGTILFGRNNALVMVPAQGGEPKLIRALGKGELAQYWPQFLPDGKNFLYRSEAEKRDESGVYVASVDGKIRRKLLGADSKAIAVDGHLLFSRGDVLFAQPFDFNSLELAGEPVQLADHVLTFGNAAGTNFFASSNGVLTYRTGTGGSDVQFTWFDRSGNRLSVIGQGGQFTNPALSPDGKWLAAGRADRQVGGTRDLWLYDLVRGTNTRLTYDPGDETNAAWSPDGNRIAFSAKRQGERDIYIMDAHGTREPELLLQTPVQKNVEQWSPDGKYLVYNSQAPGAAADLYVLPLVGDRKPIAVLNSPFAEDMGQISPNGRWMAYRSNESGTSEVYVLTFAPEDPAARRKWRVSTDGGLEPQWRGDGKELFYLSGSTLMSVEVKDDGREFDAGLPKVLFDTVLTSNITRNRYVVTRDGQRFLMVTPPMDQMNPEIHVIVNWQSASNRH